MVNVINKLITHNRDTVGDFGVRVLLHIPIGLVMGIPILGWGLLYLFKAYEENEDLHTKDQAWKDYFGAMVGYVITTIIIIILWRLLWL